MGLGLFRGGGGEGGTGRNENYIRVSNLETEAALDAPMRTICLRWTFWEVPVFYYTFCEQRSLHNAISSTLASILSPTPLPIHPSIHRFSSHFWSLYLFHSIMTGWLKKRHISHWPSMGNKMARKVPEKTPNWQKNRNCFCPMFS